MNLFHGSRFAPKWKSVRTYSINIICSALKTQNSMPDGQFAIIFCQWDAISNKAWSDTNQKLQILVSVVTTKLIKTQPRQQLRCSTYRSKAEVNYLMCVRWHNLSIHCHWILRTKIGFIFIAKATKALVNLGQTYSAAFHIDVRKELPSINAVRSSILQISSERKEKFRNDVDQILKIWGGITCDGVKTEVTGKTYIDFEMNHLEFLRHPSATWKKRSWKINTRLLFITPLFGVESADNSRPTIDNNLRSVTNKELADMDHQFTFITDLAATMPKIFGISIFESFVPYNQRLCGCISHQLNTAMKTAMKDTQIKDPNIHIVFEVVKKIWLFTKRVVLAHHYHQGIHWCKRLRKNRICSWCYWDIPQTEKNLMTTVTSANNDGVKTSIELYVSLHRQTYHYNTSYSPYLEAMIKCCAPLVHAQRELEASSRPNIMKDLPIIEDIKQDISFYAPYVGIDHEIMHW